MAKTDPSSEDRHHKTLLGDTLLPLRDKTISARFRMRGALSPRSSGSSPPPLEGQTDSEREHAGSDQQQLVVLPRFVAGDAAEEMTDEPLPPDVLLHANTMKFADKIDLFDPMSDRVETQLKFRRFVHTIALRSPTTADIREYRRTTFALSTFKGVEKKELRKHLATALRISTRGGAIDLLMSIEDQQDGHALFLIPVEEYCGKYDDGAIAMAALDVTALNTYTGLELFRADWQKNNRAYLGSTGSAVPPGMQRRQFLEALRTHANAAIRDPPRAPEALAGLHLALMAETLTPEQMLGELTIARNALTASGVDVFAGDNVGADLVLSAATARGTNTYESCNGRGTVELSRSHSEHHAQPLRSARRTRPRWARRRIRRVRPRPRQLQQQLVPRRTRRLAQQPRQSAR